MSLEQLEKQLQALERIESYSKEEQATLIASAIAEQIMTMPREQLVPFFKSMILSNPDMLDMYMDVFKGKLLKQYRDAIRMARRRPKITRR